MLTVLNLIAITSAVILFILFCFYLNGIFYEIYWRNRGVKFYGEHKNFGIFWDFIFKDKSTVDCVSSIYDKYKEEPAVGIGCTFIPGIFVISPDNALHVLQDEAFNCRPMYVNEHDYLGSNNILFLKGTKWKLVRQKFTMLFTTAKLKNMFFRLNNTAKEFVEYLKTENISKEVTWHTMHKYSGTAATSSIFGIRSEKVFDSPFVTQVQKGFPANVESFIRIGIGIAAPFISKALNLKMFGKVEHFFMSATKIIIEKTKEDDSGSFKDMYENSQKKIYVKHNNTDVQLEISDEVIAANIFFFCAASTIPGSASLFCALYELAKSARIQDKLRKEIDTVFTKHNGQITYDIILNMTYLDNVYNETLRKYPSVTFITRKCIKDSVLPTRNIKISKGTLLLVPTHAIQNDPRYVTDPHLFIPERFKDGTVKRSLYFFPFGGGRRLCLGLRYTSLQVKAGLMHIVRNFKIETHAKRNELKFLRNVFSLELDDLPLTLVPIEQVPTDN